MFDPIMKLRELGNTGIKVSRLLLRNPDLVVAGRSYTATGDEIGVLFESSVAEVQCWTV